ncbi:MAG: hypothetical protein PHX37_02480 [Eubacteriales bacterium]|nr:hypothetical protein [Eubacteriales bacterium]
MKAADIARNSIFYKTVSGIRNAYSHSFVARIFRSLSEVYKSSKTYSLFHSGVEKEPAGKNSVSYKVIKRSLVSADKAAGGVSSLLSKYYKFSVPAKIAASVNTSRKAGALLMFFTAGYSLGNTLLGKWSIYRAVFALASAVFSLAVFFTADKWKAWYKSGMLNRIVNFLFEK